MIGYPFCTVCGTETTLDSIAQEPWKCGRVRGDHEC
jgi:hypothetical protein